MAGNVAHIPPHLEALGVSRELVEKFAKYFKIYDISGQALAGEKAIAVECHWDWIGNVPESIEFNVGVIRLPLVDAEQSVRVQRCKLFRTSPTEGLLFEFASATQPCKGYAVYLDSGCEIPEWDENNNKLFVYPLESDVILAPKPKF